MINRTSDRVARFIDLKNHHLIGTWLKKLKKDEYAFCLAYLEEHKALTDNEFVFKVNRMHLGKPSEARKKNDNLICDLLCASIEPMIRPNIRNKGETV